MTAPKYSLPPKVETAKPVVDISKDILQAESNQDHVKMLAANLNLVGPRISNAPLLWGRQHSCVEFCQCVTYESKHFDDIPQYTLEQ